MKKNSNNKGQRILQTASTLTVPDFYSFRYELGYCSLATFVRGLI
ncbi:TPA: hypothetical protein ACGOXH_000219 [Streptococcus suis]